SLPPLALGTLPISVEIVEVPNPATWAEGIFALESEDGHGLLLVVSRGRLYLAPREPDAIPASQEIGTYSEETRFWRFRPDGAVIHAETSPDGVSWTTRGQASSAPFQKGVFVRLGGGTWQSEAAPGAFAVTNLNGGAPAVPFC